MQQKKYQNQWEKGAQIIERQRDGITPFMAGIVTGFTMGEGSFFLAVKRSKTHKTGFNVVPTFGINLKLDDFEILEQIKNLLGCGTVLKGKKAVMYRVTKFKDVLEIVIPFFDRYPLINVKKDDFNLFKIVVFKFAYGEGKTLEGIEKMVSVRKHMNNGKSAKREN
ncbi:LAGLIDADG family homing endonuclease [Peribacillus deserti]|uniref:Endonuclease n=1 Tax=Peribacillus deserti TaxID=673318 RepID=A0A2N5M1G7_9BACI|nr:LAGLIDADG family homing endonuclease [Peribacillus deserti]PLT28200.1 endonuclease [Peribacillus deserti]